MTAHWLKLIHDADLRASHFLATQITDPASGCAGSTPTAWGIPDPKPTLMQAATAVACALNPDSRLYRDPRVPGAYRLALEFAFSVLNDDGTFDFPPANFRSAPDTAFILNRVFVTRGLLVKSTEPALTGLLPRIDELLERAGRGILAGGFHTPNHRWACAAALSSCHVLTGDEAFRWGADRYLLEGIDNNDDGEYAERSAGNYNVVNDDQMLVLADTRGDPSFLDPIEKNLAMMVCYLDPDGSVFTGNSTRQDRDTLVYPEQYYFHYLNLSHRRKRPDFASVARAILDRQMASGQPAPDVLDLVMLHLGGIDYVDAPAELPSRYRRLFAESGVARCRKDEFSYSLLRDHKHFLHVQSGRLRVSVRLGVGFFERRDFVPTSLIEEDGEFVLRLTARGWYYLPFSEKPETSDWWAMDHKRREKLWGPDLDFTVRVQDKPDGIDVKLQAGGWDKVPLRLELGFSAGALLENSAFDLETVAGGALSAKSGDLVLSDGLDVLSVGPAFSQHRNRNGTYGSEGRQPQRFTVYLTALTPVDRVLSFRRLSPRRSKP